MKNFSFAQEICQILQFIFLNVIKLLLSQTDMDLLLRGIPIVLPVFRVFFVFWALLGIACAAANLQENDNFDEIIPDCDENSYSLTVRRPKSKNVSEGEREKAQNE